MNQIQRNSHCPIHLTVDYSSEPHGMGRELPLLPRSTHHPVQPLKQAQTWPKAFVGLQEAKEVVESRLEQELKS